MKELTATPMFGARSTPRSFLLSLVLLCFLTACARGKGEVTARNKTGQTIVEGHLRIGSKVFDLSGLGAGESRAFPFQSAECSPCEYQLSLTLANHYQAIQSIGSIRGGMDYHDSLLIEKDVLSLESSQNPNGNNNLTYKGSQSKKLKFFR